MDKIKSFLWDHRTDVLTVVILVLVATAAFQMGRLSVFTDQQSDFGIVHKPL